MTKKDAIKIFENKKIRAIWDDTKEEWYFSIVDVVAVLTESNNSNILACTKKEIIRRGKPNRYKL
jgi:prophage antirepressor-like protein